MSHTSTAAESAQPGQRDELHDADKAKLRRQKDREKITARRSRRATYDLPPLMREEIQDLSAELRIPASQLVTLALAQFLKAYRSGEIDLSVYKQPSRSPRYDWNLVIPDHYSKLKKLVHP